VQTLTVCIVPRVGINVEGRNDDERLLSPHVKSSHTSTKVYGRYCSAEARCALMPNRKLSLFSVVDIIVVR
jgi:hypothetical protein